MQLLTALTFIREWIGKIEMRYPKNLQQKGTIGFVAPSFGCQTEPYYSAFQNALKKFREMGYQADIGPNCYEGVGIGISNTPRKCATELMEYYCSGKNDCLISCGGGELMCEILEYMDFEALKQAPPKWFMGYSDNTNMTYLLATLCDTASVYGPCAGAFGMEPWHPALGDAFRLLTGEKTVEGISHVKGYDMWEKESMKDEEHPLAPYHVTERKILRSYIGKQEVPRDEKIQFEGRLLGGCMDCLVTLLGTRFDKTVEFVQQYREEGIIWFLEACDLNVFSIRRAMWQMEQAGWFRYVKGFLIGRPLCFGQEMMGLDACNAVLEVAGRKNVPVIMDMDLGHLPPAMPVVTGSRAVVEVCGNDITLRYEFR